jgi:hypothetical protein
MEWLQSSHWDGAIFLVIPGTSCLATIVPSLPDENHPPVQAPRIILALIRVYPGNWVYTALCPKGAANFAPRRNIFYVPMETENAHHQIRRHFSFRAVFKGRFTQGKPWAFLALRAWASPPVIFVQARAGRPCHNASPTVHANSTDSRPAFNP